MGDALLKVEGISGATDLGDGRVVLIVDAPALARGARGGRHRAPASRGRGTASGQAGNGAIA
jgi:chemotaxis protein histidine kinase CheA